MLKRERDKRSGGIVQWKSSRIFGPTLRSRDCIEQRVYRITQTREPDANRTARLEKLSRDGLGEDIGEVNDGERERRRK